VDCLDIATQRSLINALLELEHLLFKGSPGQGVPFIHRSLNRVHNLFTPTRTFIFHAIVSTSAYPLAFPTAFAIWTILTVSTHSVDACSCARPAQESGTRVPLFLMLVFRSFRAALSPGFLVGEHWSLLKTPATILAFWPSLLIRVGCCYLRRLRAFTSVAHSYPLAGVPRRIRSYPLSTPHSPD